MSIPITRVFSSDEYLALGDKAVADGFYRNDPRIFLPGMAWYMDWVYDPTGRREQQGRNVMIKAAQKGTHPHLSKFYWEAWADKRPPICVICPNGETWEIDRGSSNGPGWRVTGTLPNITCHPSIVVTGYHGYLQNGQFTKDLEGRGPMGLTRKALRTANT